MKPKTVDRSKINSINKNKKEEKALKQGPFDVFKNDVSNLQTKSLQPLVEYMLAEKLVDKDELKAAYAEHSDKMTNLFKLVPEFFHVEYHDMGRRFLFKFMQEKMSGAKVPGVPRITNYPVFESFLQKVIAENGNFFPLYDRYIEKVFKGEPNVIFVPSITNPEYNNSKTAGMTINVDLILNTAFCQDLMNFAHLTGVQGKTKKYKSKGGRFSDAYQPIEVLIVHEFYHFIYGDFHMNALLKDKLESKSASKQHTIINYATDCRSNYKMTADGHGILPIGIYSPYLNGEQYEYTGDIAIDIEQLMKKLPEGEEPKGMDDHYDSDSHKTRDVGEEGEPDEGEGEGGEGEKGKGNGEGEESDEEGDGDGKGKESGGEGKSSTGRDKNSALAKATKRALERVTEEKMREIEEHIKNMEFNNEDAKITNERAMDEGTPKESKRDKSSRVADTSAIQATFNWQQILKRVVSAASDETEDSWARVNRKMGGRLATAQQTGVAALKPGEIPTTKNKLVFVIDSSGSMNEVVNRIYSEFKKLMLRSELDDEILIFNFSGEYFVHLCNIKTRKAKKLSNLTLKPVAEPPTTIANVLLGQNDNTELSPAMVTSLLKYAKADYNIVFTSDQDVLYGENYAQLHRLVKGCRNKLFTIFNDQRNYDMFVKLNGNSVSKNTSFWN